MLVSQSSDSLLARNTCIALQKLAKPTIKGDGPILSCHERISRSVSSRTLTVILDKLASLVKVDSSAAGTCKTHSLCHMLVLPDMLTRVDV